MAEKKTENYCKKSTFFTSLLSAKGQVTIWTITPEPLLQSEPGCLRRDGWERDPECARVRVHVAHWRAETDGMKSTVTVKTCVSRRRVSVFTARALQSHLRRQPQCWLWQLSRSDTEKHTGNICGAEGHQADRLMQPQIKGTLFFCLTVAALNCVVTLSACGLRWGTSLL